MSNSKNIMLKYHHWLYSTSNPTVVVLEPNGFSKKKTVQTMCVLFYNYAL